MNIDMKVTPTVSVPKTVEPGEEINITDVNTDIEIDLTGDLANLRDFINPFNGTIEFFNFEVNNETKNVLPEGGVQVNDVEQAEEYVPFSIDGADTKFAGSEEDITIQAGEINAEINANAFGASVDI